MEKYAEHEQQKMKYIEFSTERNSEEFKRIKIKMGLQLVRSSGKSQKIAYN